jgi:predicted ATPase
LAAYCTDGHPQEALRAAKASYLLARDTARRQESKFFELRAAVGLGRLLQGRPDEARTLVQDVYDRFDQGFDTHDLKEARSLLKKLS